MFALVRNGMIQQRLPMDVGFSIEGQQYSPNWLRVVSIEEKNSQGIYEVVEDSKKDERFYWSTEERLVFDPINNTGLTNNSTSKSNIVPEFYEFEPGIVLDVILDESHPILANKKIDITSFPDNYKDAMPSMSDVDCTWIGRILVRMCYSQQGITQEKLKSSKQLIIIDVHNGDRKNTN